MIVGYLARRGLRAFWTARELAMTQRLERETTVRGPSPFMAAWKLLRIQDAFRRSGLMN